MEKTIYAIVGFLVLPSLALADLSAEAFTLMADSPVAEAKVDDYTYQNYHLKLEQEEDNEQEAVRLAFKYKF